MLVLYATTLFTSSALLFWLQPMYAKMILPKLGGTPTVWNSCIFFFQAILLVGYVYAHSAIARLGVRRQASLHLGLILLPFLTLPIAFPRGWIPPTEQNPIPSLLLLLLVAIGLPFFVLSANAPMLQKWFAQTRHPSARDPYFLYAASNLGSMVALVSYPVLIEPNLGLKNQSSMWSLGYALQTLLTLGCAVTLWRSAPMNSIKSSVGSLQRESLGQAGSRCPNLIQRFYWVLWSFVPSSLLLGVTTYLTTNITPVPLFWVLPLTIYLLTFVLVFARKPILPHWLMVRMLPFTILALVLSIFLNIPRPFWLLFVLHLLNFFVIAMICHGHLARSRPATQFLTDFFMWISIGGVAGGFFNALLAPLIFNTAMEYSFALILACLVQPQEEPEKEKVVARIFDFGLPLCLGLLTLGLIWSLKAYDLQSSLFRPIILFGIPILLCFSFRKRPLRLGLGIGAIMLSTLYLVDGRVLETQRTFYGIYRIVLNEQKEVVELLHGNVSHGQQSTVPTRRTEPLSYYYSTGPIGQVFSALSDVDSKSPVAIVGLGTGSLACYGKPGQRFTFYEIDPVIEAIARNPRYFTYLRDCPADMDVVLGDARLSLQEAPDRQYGLIILDAFSSDAIPIHLLTHEALNLYLSKLADGGVLVFHISNLYLDLKPVLGELSKNMGLASLEQADFDVSEDERKKGKAPSQWIVMARKMEYLGSIPQNPRWKSIPEQTSTQIWTDDFSNILGMIRWN